MGGDTTVGSLLAQIVFWHLPNKAGKSKLRVQKLDRMWVAKTRDQWMAECSLTLERYKRAIRVLRAIELIEVKQMKFAGLNVSHIRLLCDPVKLLQVGLPPKHATLEWCKTRHSKSGVNHATLVQRVQTETRTPDLAQTQAQEAGGKEKEERENRGTVDSVQAGAHSRAEEALVKASEIVAAKRAAPSPATGKLSAFWASRCATVCGGYQKPLTGKEAGQLKQLCQYCGDTTRDVIDYAVNHWWKFAARAGAEAGTPYPTSPHIGFLLKHHAVVVNLLRPPPTPVAVTSTAPVVQSVAATRPEDVPHRMTAQELADMLAGLKG